MEQATEKQISYIKSLTADKREGIQAEWAYGGYRLPQRTGLKAKYGKERVFDMTREEFAAEWQKTVAGVLAYLDEIDARTSEMTKAQASETIDGLKNMNIVALYWQNRGEKS